MTFDCEEHKNIIMSMINQATFPGNLIEVACALKKAVQDGSVVPLQGGSVQRENVAS